MHVRNGPCLVFGPGMVKSDMAEAESPAPLFIVAIVGDAGVGKTCLLERFAYGTYADNGPSTRGLEIRARRVRVEEGKVRLQLWELGTSDTSAPSDDLAEQRRAIFAGVHGVIVLFDVRKPSSFESVGRWLHAVDACAPPSACRMLVAAKDDDAGLHDFDSSGYAEARPHEFVPSRVASEFASSRQMLFASMSSREDRGVGSAIQRLVSAMVHSRTARARRQRPEQHPQIIAEPPVPPSYRPQRHEHSSVMEAANDNSQHGYMESAYTKAEEVAGGGYGAGYDVVHEGRTPSTNASTSHSTRLPLTDTHNPQSAGDGDGELYPNMPMRSAHAAARLQAVHRGKSDRRMLAVRQQQQGQPKLPPQQPVPQQRQVAATRLQAAHRGRSSRQQLNARGAHRALPPPGVSPLAATPLDDVGRQRAALQMQAAHRGRSTRQLLSNFSGDTARLLLLRSLGMSPASPKKPVSRQTASLPPPAIPSPVVRPPVVRPPVVTPPVPTPPVPTPPVETPPVVAPPVVTRTSPKRTEAVVAEVAPPMRNGPPHPRSQFATTGIAVEKTPMPSQPAPWVEALLACVRGPSLVCWPWGAASAADQLRDQTRAAIAIQRRYRGRSKYLSLNIRLSLKALPPAKVAAACVDGLVGIARLISDALGNNVWQRALYNAPDEWDEEEMVAAMTHAITRPARASEISLLATPTKYERMLLELYARVGTPTKRHAATAIASPPARQTPSGGVRFAANDLGQPPSPRQLAARSDPAVQKAARPRAPGTSPSNLPSEPTAAAVEWMVRVIGLDLYAADPALSRCPNDMGLVHRWLRSGERLCELVNCVRPGSVGRVARASTKPFQQMENIAQYLDACAALGVPAHELFQTVDLWEGTGMRAVVRNLHSLGRAAQAIPGFNGPHLGPPPPRKEREAIANHEPPRKAKGREAIANHERLLSLRQALL